MKKIGGILAALLGTGLIAGGIAAVVKNKKQGDYVDVSDENDAIEVEAEEVVEDSEE